MTVLEESNIPMVRLKTKEHLNRTRKINEKQNRNFHKALVKSTIVIHGHKTV